MTADSVITETRTEITTEEVTETRYRCHVCDMVYDEQDVVTIGIDRSELPETPLSGGGVEPRVERIVCRHCTDGLFDYEPSEDSTVEEPGPTFKLDWVTGAGAAGALTLLVAGPILVAGTALGVVIGGGVLVPAVGVAFAFGVLLGVMML